MAEIVNLNRYRKAKGKAAAEVTAVNNRLLFGRKRVEKDLARKAAAKEKEDLDGKKLND